MKIPLHESLLRDAELASESDPRVAILDAALACDMFIQHWLENNGYIRSRKWLN